MVPLTNARAQIIKRTQNLKEGGFSEEILSTIRCFVEGELDSNIFKTPEMNAKYAQIYNIMFDYDIILTEPSKYVVRIIEYLGKTVNITCSITHYKPPVLNFSPHEARLTVERSA